MKNGLQATLGVCLGGWGHIAKAQATHVFGGITSGPGRLGFYTGVWKTKSRLMGSHVWVTIHECPKSVSGASAPGVIPGSTWVLDLSISSGA